MFELTDSASCSSYLTIRNFIIIIICLGSYFFQFANTENGYDYCRYNNSTKKHFSCGNGVTFQYPFWRRIDEEEEQQWHYYCGYPGLGITCNPSNNKPMINIYNQIYYVIHANNSLENQITIVDPNFIQKTCPGAVRMNALDQNSNSSSNSSQSVFDYNRQLTFSFGCNSPPPQISSTGIVLSNQSSQKCSNYKDTMRSYVFVDLDLERDRTLQKFLDSWNWNHCIYKNVIVPVADVDQATDWMKTLETGFRVRWAKPIECQRCENSGGFCSYNETESTYTCRCGGGQLRHSADRKEYYCYWDNGICSVFGGLASLMILLLFVYHRNNQRKRIGSIAQNVELFLESYGYRSLQRYKYKDIKKMTNSFKDKLGQGGYGSVYKGKLVDGRLVAVKVLINDPKKSTNGEDFMNEVATIGRTNHVNIVALLGFCSSGSKRALVYEFMTNGSLEKFIYAEKEKKTITSMSNNEVNSTSSIEVHAQGLGWEKLYQIAVGIARGLEYLHRGCNTGRILHFDIKPHNILLDENFCPKISDFGLAKLCPTRDSIVSMLSGGRGTIGYIAPEVYNRNFGGVSYKSDVYSYGMMVLEMVGGRKNIDPFIENTSQIYFPHWIYNHLEKDQDKIEGLLKFEAAFDQEMAMKMIMVGLWCIQTHQESRPSMGKVAEMLEGSIKDFQMPPNPFVDPSLHPPPTS